MSHRRSPGTAGARRYRALGIAALATALVLPAAAAQAAGWQSGTATGAPEGHDRRPDIAADDAGGRGAAIAAEQDGAARVAIGQVAAPSVRDPAGLPQLTTPGGTPAEAQIARPDRDILATPAAAQRDRTTQGTSPLSRPDDGRDLATPRLAGRDRCDPRDPRFSNAPSCRTAIETRADSFATPKPDLSPEQRLLVERYAPDEARGLLAEVRRVGRNDVDPASVDAQALAAVIQAERERARVAAAVEADAAKAAAAAAVSVVTNALNGNK